MSYRLLKIVIISLIFAALISAAPLAFSQSAGTDAEINDLNLKIQQQKQQLQAIQAQQQQYQAQITAKEKDRISLSNQLIILEDQLAKSQLDIDGVNLEMDETSLEIQKIIADGAALDQKIEQQKQHLADLLSLIYKQDQISPLEMLLLNNSLADFLNQAKYLSDTNQEIINSVESLKQSKAQLDQNKLDLDQKNKDLLALKAQLQDKKDSLSYEQANKNDLLTETKSSERTFQNLLQQARQQQQQTEADIASAEQLIRQKMSQQDQVRLNSNSTINWPVPQNVIITKFHDPDYPYRNLIGEHSGVDIRAKLGTTIMAAADGYVAKVKFDGTKNYAYIMLIHGNGLATVYGHVSAVYVQTDQYVTQGQPIGRTGGMPGGIGSGPFTTGPHLHFEVRLNGLPVDPMNYLP